MRPENWYVAYFKGFEIQKDDPPYYFFSLMVYLVVVILTIYIVMKRNQAKNRVLSGIFWAGTDFEKFKKKISKKKFSKKPLMT